MKHYGEKMRRRDARRRRKKRIRALIVIELVGVFIAFGSIVHTSLVRIFEEHSELATSTVYAFTSEQAVPVLTTAFEEAMVVPCEDTVWTTEETEYTEKPGEKAAGTVGRYTRLDRNATLRTGWSRVLIDEKEYYISDEYLTTELPFPIAAGVKGDYQLYALSLFPDFGWADSELEPLIYLWNRESGWNPLSHNKRSGAHGIPQALPGRKMASEGADYYTNGRTQIRWGLKYIRGRYGSPSSAWAHFRSKGWY